ncbi:MAG: dipeptidase [Chloroflexi bacterium]|nr:dipeptidase [Chloroflexota bacterium]
MTSPHEYAQQHAERFRAQWFELLRIPSVSTLTAHGPDVERAAAWLHADMQRIGMGNAAIITRPGRLPLVFGEWHGAGPAAPTVLIYCHYDVQPAAMADGWTRDPFTPVEEDGKVYARGALDSKGHVVAHLKAVESLLAADDPAPVNIKLLFEGEEESGSTHIFKFVPEQRDKLAADVCIVSDGSMPDVDQPVLVYGLRGLVTMELTVTGPRRDLHSGHYGGSVHNPIQALTEILAALHDSDGRVTVPGFYDDVRPLDAAERAALAAIGPWIETEWQAVTGAPQPWGEPDFAIHERIGARPTLEFNGIVGGFHEPGFKTVLPAKASAKLSCRLVPDQNPERIFHAVRDYIAKLTPPTVQSDLQWLENGAPGVLVDREAPAMQALITAYERGWGRTPILTREGGSIPVVIAFQQELGLPIVLMPFGYKGGGAHGPDEYMVTKLFHRGIDTAIHFCQIFAGQPR